MLDLPLPKMRESLLCRDYSLRHDLDPRGTALSGAVVLVELPEPWPKPVARHDVLQDMFGELRPFEERIRLLAAVPHDKRKRRIIAFRPAVGGMTRTEVEQGEDLIAGLRAALAGESATEVPVGPDADRTVLICTQGTHDACCGTFGVELADWASMNLDGVELFRVSHTGGHRFAPTAMTLPDGRMWAHLSEDRLTGVLDRSIDPADAAAFSRGWWGAVMGAAQVGELEVFAEVGWSLDAVQRSVSVNHAGNGVYRSTVQLDDGDWVVDLVERREVPTITCESPGGLPAKPHVELTIKGSPEFASAR